jgi:UMF1 family MFS transporter
VTHQSENPPNGRGKSSTAGLVSWAFYDWANSAYITVIQTFVFSAYFTRSVAVDANTGSALWGNAIGMAGLLVAVCGPILGAIADQTGRRKPWIIWFTLLCVICSGLLWFVRPDTAYVWTALLLIGLSTLGFEFASIFYNAMLPDLVPPHRIGRWSGWGWALGYAGGLACLILALLAFVDGENSWFRFNRDNAQHIRATFVLVAGWFLLFSLPLFLITPDKERRAIPWRKAVSLGMRQLYHSVREIRRYSNIIRFLVARMIFVDGLATLFVFGGIYAATVFEMTERDVLLFGIGLNVTAGVGAALFSFLDDRLGAKTTIIASLVGLAGSTLLILTVTSQIHFWIYSLVLGIFVGPCQASGRSYLARMAPAALRNEMFGLFALSGKATAFFGPLLVGWVTYLSGSQRLGMSTILLFFVVGFFLMLPVANDRKISMAAEKKP